MPETIEVGTPAPTGWPVPEQPKAKAAAKPRRHATRKRVIQIHRGRKRAQR